MNYLENGTLPTEEKKAREQYVLICEQGQHSTRGGPTSAV